MTHRHLTALVGLASAATVMALLTPTAMAANHQSRTAQISPDAAAATILTWPELVKLLRIPKPAGWSSGDLTSWELSGEVGASRVFGNVQTTGSFTMIMTAVDSWEDAAASTQM